MTAADFAGVAKLFVYVAMFLIMTRRALNAKPPAHPTTDEEFMAAEQDRQRER